jgi:Glycosyl hydrolase catalytic core
MPNSLCKLALPLLCACALGCGAAPAGAKPKLTVGISDNGTAMFSSSWFQKAHITTVRDMVFWNVAVLRNKTPLRLARAWVKAALSDGEQPMITFAGNGNTIPSVKVYTAAIKAFLHDFPQVKVYTPWNEPDWIYRPKLANNPRLAAGYFAALARWCHHCTVVAGDVYRPVSGKGGGLKGWVRAYARALGAMHIHPKAWALHPYDDVRTHTTSQIRALESVTSGPIWLTEISGVERRGHWQFKNQSPAAANRDERFLFSLPKRFPRITRIYHYQWQGTPAAPWDSGLIGSNGKPRPAYFTVRSAAAGKLP